MERDAAPRVSVVEVVVEVYDLGPILGEEGWIMPIVIGCMKKERDVSDAM
jgi:hypothetical protein